MDIGGGEVSAQAESSKAKARTGNGSIRIICCGYRARPGRTRQFKRTFALYAGASPLRPIGPTPRPLSGRVFAAGENVGGWAAPILSAQCPSAADPRSLRSGDPFYSGASPPAFVGARFRRWRKRGRIGYADRIRPPLIGAPSPVAALRGPRLFRGFAPTAHWAFPAPLRSALRRSQAFGPAAAIGGTCFAPWPSASLDFLRKSWADRLRRCYPPTTSRSAVPRSLRSSLRAHARIT